MTVTRKGSSSTRRQEQTINTQDEGVKTLLDKNEDGGNTLNSSAAVPTRGRGRQSSIVTGSPMTMASTATITRKGKGRGRAAGLAQQHDDEQHGSTHAIQEQGVAATSTSTSSMQDILPAPATSNNSSNGTRSARSSSVSSSRRRRSSRHGGVQEEEQDEPTTSNISLHDIPDNILQAQGLSSISTTLIDNLPERAFPKKGISASLHPLDMEDPLLLLCGKVLASVDNRALTPKEMALILARRYGWLFNGSQPWSIVSSCIRSHVKRANASNPPYAPAFIPYEMSSVPPAEDIPCLGIEIDAKPVVKRGTFWYLSEQMGYGHAFPHRRNTAAAAAISTTSVTAPSTSSDLMSTSTSTTIPTAQPQTQTSQSSTIPSTSKIHRRSSSRHQPQLLAPVPIQPIPIMPAPPAAAAAAPTSSLSAFTLPHLPLRRTKGDSKSGDIKTDRLTRAQKTAQATPTPPISILQQGLVQSPSPGLEGQHHQLSASAPAATSDMQVDKLGRGKRKRTISKAVLPLQQPAADSSYPHLQPLPTDLSAQANTPQAQAVVAPAIKPPAKGRGGPHRRALSSSASDKLAQKPIPALRRLKFRLSAVSENAVLESDTSSSSIAAGDLSTVSLPASTTTTKRITISNPKASTKASSSKQPKNKRARTQSMSHRTNTTASFPFDDLHLHHSMQLQAQGGGQGLPSSLHNAPSFHTSSQSSAEGTLFPFEMHMPSSPGSAMDLLTSRSAPEGNIFSPALAAAQHHNDATSGASTSYIAGPFSRSHSPSSSLLSYHHHHHSGRRSLPPNYGNEDQANEADESALQYDGWGMEHDHLDSQGSDVTSRDGKHQGEHSFHEAMLKNDDIDFAFDFSLGSLGESASRRPYIDDELQGGNLSLEDSSREEDHSVVDDSLLIGDEEESFVAADESRRSRSSTVRDTSSKEPSFGKHEMDSMLDGLDDEETENSNETVKEKRPASVSRRTSSTSEDVDMSAEVDESMAEQKQEAKQDASTEQTEGEEEDDEDESHAAMLDRKAFEKALNTTLCPAAAKFSIGSDGHKAARLLIKRVNSSSNLNFTRTVPKTSSFEAANRSPTATPLLRPALVSRTHSRDVLSTAVPLAELPSIPLENSRRDSFLFYHLTSDADHPLDYSSAYLENGKESDNSTRDDMSDAASSSSASTSSSLLTRHVKSEEELDEMIDLEEHAQDSPSTHRGVSRCCSTASAISQAEVESNDSFNPEMIYAIGRRAPSAELGNIGGQGEIDELRQQHNSRSQSSSRTTSLSPRDSFSPNMVGPHGSSSSDLDADWALTPPSEEEHVDEDEKNLDRATMLGLESVGMDDLDDVWPGVRRSLGGGAASSSAGGKSGIEAQVDGVTCDFRIMEVFEPVLPAAPIPQVDLPSPVFTMHTPLHGKAEAGEADDTAMEVDNTPMDEHAAAAMFIADESLHPPKPSPVVTATAASEEPESATPQPSLSPESAAAKDASTSADAQQSASLNDSQQKSPKVAAKQASSATPQQQAPEPPASTQSFLFNPDVPFHPEISILLTDTKILFYSTIVNVSNDGRPLLRRVDNDAVDAEALLLSLEGASDMDGDRFETLRKIKEMGNTWVSLDFARELLKKYGGPEPLLGIFLADDILLSWPEKLVKLGTMLRQKNGLPPPASTKAKPVKTATSKPEKSVHRVPSLSPKMMDKQQPIQPKKPSSSKSPAKEAMIRDTTPVPIQAKKEVEASSPSTSSTSSSSSPGKKDKAAKANAARRASSRIKS